MIAAARPAVQRCQSEQREILAREGAALSDGARRGLDDWMAEEVLFVDEDASGE
jgi:hypothetical protein